MKEVLGFLFFVWAFVVSPTMVAALWGADVRQDQIMVAFKACAEHGGLASIDGTAWQNVATRTTSVRCVDHTTMVLQTPPQKGGV